MNNIIKSPYDARDYKAEDILDLTTEIPEEYEAPRTLVRCQWFSSQCVAFAATQAISQQEILISKSYNTYSTGLLYANRELDDFQGEGWYVRKALKQLHKYGTCLNEDFPHNHSYAEERKHFLERKDELLEKASIHRIKNYFKCDSESMVKRCIMQKGCVIASGPIGKFWLFKGNLTRYNQGSFGGGHAYIIVGWTKDGKWILQDSYSIFRPCLGRPKMSMDCDIDEFWGITI